MDLGKLFIRGVALARRGVKALPNRTAVKDCVESLLKYLRLNNFTSDSANLATTRGGEVR